MAAVTKKDKLLDEAQKLVLRGQFDKAAKCYEQIVSLDPAAVNQRQKLAEILIKAGRTDDARKEFETIGKHFSDNGFYLKSIAVYKQLLKLFPADVTISLILAGLYEKHGLTANALSEYKRVYDYYEKLENTSEAFKILEDMHAADQQNIPVSIKLAESRYQLGQKDEAYTLFVRAAALLQEKRHVDGAAKLNARILELFPEKTEFMLEVLSGQISGGNPAAALHGLQSLLRSSPTDRRVWDLIVEAYKRLGQTQRVKAAYQHYHKMLPDEPVPIVGLIYCCIEDRDVDAALDLLDIYERTLLAAGMSADLEMMYRALREFDTDNSRVHERFSRAVGAGERGGDAFIQTEMVPPAATVSEYSRSEPIVPESALEETGQDELLPVSENDIEIELDIDDDLTPGLSEEYATGDSSDKDGWLDSVGQLFDAIAIAPSGVRYGSEMETSDAQSHFDLGLAFKEMGLYDEAIKEFREASSEPARRMACLIMQGACLRERGEFNTAVSMLRSLLKPGLHGDDSCAVKYELVLTYESMGRADEATALLNEIVSENPDFRDASSRLSAAKLDNSLVFSDEDLKDF